jgi:hypothetical protein
MAKWYRFAVFVAILFALATFATWADGQSTLGSYVALGIYGVLVSGAVVYVAWLGRVKAIDFAPMSGTLSYDEDAHELTWTVRVKEKDLDKVDGLFRPGARIHIEARTLEEDNR